jgi:hypothetical protein
MHPDIKNMTMTEKADAAFKQAAAKVIERGRQTATPVILWENGQIVKRSWKELINEPTKTPEISRENDSESASGQACGETAEEGIG